MKKYALFGLLFGIMPGVCMAQNATISKLIHEKQRKMEQLEKCMGTSKGLKIAGLSTIGLTAAGVVGNIAEAKARDNYDSKISAMDKKIESTKSDIEKTREKIAKDKEDYEYSHTLKNAVASDIAAINLAGSTPGDRAIVHGYKPQQLPDDRLAELKTALSGFVERCKALAHSNHIKSVLVTNETAYENPTHVGGYTDSTALPDLKEYVLMECQIDKCDDKYTEVENQCVAASDDGVKNNYTAPQKKITCRAGGGTWNEEGSKCDCPGIKYWDFGTQKCVDSVIINQITPGLGAVASNAGL